MKSNKPKRSTRKTSRAAVVVPYVESAAAACRYYNTPALSIAVAGGPTHASRSKSSPCPFFHALGIAGRQTAAHCQSTTFERCSSFRLRSSLFLIVRLAILPHSALAAGSSRSISR